jgi:hypothetical protein
MEKLTLWWSSDRHKLYFFGFVYAVMSCIKWLQLMTLKPYGSNNFQIFHQSFFHLIHHQQLYVAYPAEHWDYFFYHPVFALLFAPFALMPEKIGLVFWLCFLTVVFFQAVIKIPFKRNFLWVFLVLAIFEFSKNIGHAQPNILNCALMLFAFFSFEKNNLRLAAFLCVLLFCIKGFGAIVGIMCFLYPNAWKTIGYSILFFIILSLSPLCVLSFPELGNHYLDWLNILRGSEIVESLSLEGFIKFTLQWQQGASYLMGVGVALLGLSWLSVFVRRQSLTIEDRLVFLSFLLLWVVAFNRATESPTYLYAVVGALILYHFGKPNKIWTVIFCICFYFITILPTDLSPRILREWDSQYFFRPLFLLPFLFFALHQFFRAFKSHLKHT